MSFRPEEEQVSEQEREEREFKLGASDVEGHIKGLGQTQEAPDEAEAREDDEDDVEGHMKIRP
jgi:hypothetical protein